MPFVLLELLLKLFFASLSALAFFFKEESRFFLLVGNYRVYIHVVGSEYAKSKVAPPFFWKVIPDQEAFHTQTSSP